MIEVHNVVLYLYFNENVAQANLRKTGDFIYFIGEQIQNCAKLWRLSFNDYNKCCKIND